MKDIRVFGVPSRVCWIVFIVAQISIMAFMIATLAVEQWVKLEPEEDERYSFEGGILKLTDGLEEIDNPFLPFGTVDVSGNIYAKLRCASDLVINVFGSADLTTEKNWLLFKSWRTMFGNLWLSGGLFLVFELLALISVVIIIATLTMLIFNRYYLHLNFCASGCMWASHLIAIIGWLGYNDITFEEDDCDELYDGTDPPTLCVMTGPKLGIFVLIYTTCIMIPYFVVIIFYSNKLSGRLHEAGDGTKRVISLNEDQVNLN